MSERRIGTIAKGNADTIYHIEGKPGRSLCGVRIVELTSELGYNLCIKCEAAA